MTDRPFQRLSPIRQLILTRLREFYREPSAVFWVYVFPLLMTLTLGLAFRADPKPHYDVTIVESDNSRLVVERLRSDERGRFTIRELPYEKARRLLRTGKTDLVLITAEEGSASAAPPSSDGLAAVRFWFDPRNQNSSLARIAVDDFLQRAEGRKDVFLSNTKIMDEPGGRYIDFLIPGLICMNLMGSGLWGVGFAVVDLRIRGLLKRLFATPMRRRDFLLATMISRMCFLIPELLMVILFARFVFGVQIFGNLWLVAGLILLGSFQFAGIGLLVASRAKTIETVSGLMNLVMLPNWIFAGIFFSSSKFPAAMQALVQALPLTPLVDALRAVMLEGAGPITILPQLGVILLWTFGSFALALRFFRWN